MMEPQLNSVNPPSSPPPLPQHGVPLEADQDYLPDSSLEVANLVGQRRLEETKEFPPITVDNINQLREESKKSSGDYKLQLYFARYLLEAVKHLKPNPQDPNRVRLLKDNLTSESIKIIKRLASHKVGYADAQFFLGNLYGAGEYLKTDAEKAFGLYLQGSKQNHPECTYRAAVCYELGLGTRKDTRYAVQFYRKAANLSDPSAMFKLAMILLHALLGQQRNPKEAVSWLTRAANMSNDQHHPQSIHELAKLYEQQPQDMVDNSNSNNNNNNNNGSSSSLLLNTSVIPDLDYARELYSQAAQLGYAPSQYRLGLAYENGELNCPVDAKRSIAWYSRAAEQNDGNAELALSGWYLTGADLILAQSDREAYLWAVKAAEKGLPKAEYAVGYYLEMGIGAPPQPNNLQNAFLWYQKAAAHGDIKAKQRLENERNQRPVKRRPTRDKNGKPAKDGDCKIM